MQRYFLNEKEYLENSILENNFHHMKNVMRMKIKDKFIINYNKLTFLCQILEIRNTEIYFEKITEILENNELALDITLIMGFPKNDKLDLIIQKSVELGVSNILLTYMDRSIVKQNKEKTSSKLERFNKIIKEACEQSKRNKLVHIKESDSLNSIDYSVYDKVFVCYEKEHKLNLKSILTNVEKNEKVAFIVGPEGGISEKEVAFLEKNHFLFVSLGKRILRCETAPFYFLSVLSYELEQS